MLFVTAQDQIQNYEHCIGFLYFPPNKQLYRSCADNGLRQTFRKISLLSLCHSLTLLWHKQVQLLLKDKGRRQQQHPWLSLLTGNLLWCLQLGFIPSNWSQTNHADFLVPWLMISVENWKTVEISGNSTRSSAWAPPSPYHPDVLKKQTSFISEHSNSRNPGFREDCRERTLQQLRKQFSAERISWDLHTAFISSHLRVTPPEKQWQLYLRA